MTVKEISDDLGMSNLINFETRAQSMRLVVCDDYTH